MESCYVVQADLESVIFYLSGPNAGITSVYRYILLTAIIPFTPFKKIFLFYFYLSVCLSVHAHMCTGNFRTQKKVLQSLSQSYRSCEYLGARN